MNVTPHLTFNEPVNELTIPPALNLYYEGYSLTIPATVTVSADRLSATLTPNALLLPNTYYYFTSAATPTLPATTATARRRTSTPETVLTPRHHRPHVNPSNGQTVVPINAHVSAVMSDDIDPTSITNNSITVKQGSTNIAGTITLASDGVTLTFVPTSALTASTLYNVTVGGFKDIEGNAVTTSNSSFTTGTTGYGSGTFTVVSTSPASGATGVSVTSPVTLNMTNLINAASVNPNTVFVYVNSTSQVLAGTYSVNGASVTFTPLTPYPANTLMGFGAYGLTDEARQSRLPIRLHLHYCQHRRQHRPHGHHLAGQWRYECRDQRPGGVDLLEVDQWGHH